MGADGIVFLDLEEGETRNREGMRLLQRGDMRGAERCFREAIDAAPLIPAAYNNLALAQFAQGELAEAIRTQEGAATRGDLPNPFGLAQLVHLYLVAGRDAEAEATMARALAVPDMDPSALARVLQSLALLGRHETILDLARGFQGPVEDPTHWFAGVAAANLGRTAEALAHLGAIGRSSPTRVRARELMRRLESGAGAGTIEGKWPYFECLEIVPRGLFDRGIRGLKADSAGEVPWLHTRAMVDMLVALLEREGDRAAAAVGMLAAVRHERATAVLKKIAEGTFGTDSVRLEAIQALQERGAWSRDEVHRVWLQGQWRDVKTAGYMIDPDAPASKHDVPAALMPRYEKAFEASRRQRWRLAETLWRELLVEASDHPPFHLNLATALVNQDRAEEAEAFLRRAAELEPGYLFAPANLAVVLTGFGRTEEAREVLDDIVVPEPVHPSALAAYMSAQIQVAMAEREPEKALGWLKMAESVAADDPNIRRLAEHLKPLQMMGDMVDLIRDRKQARAAKLRGRVLTREASLEACFGAYSKSDLGGMAKALGIGLNASEARKADLLAAVCGFLREDRNRKAALGKLEPQDRAALRDLLAAGGRQDYAAFARHHGTDAEDSDNWAVDQPRSVLGRLKCRGLVVGATVDRAESVLIPRELSLDPAWLEC
jgi:tetratricopeptide (TPR) repeat protein